MRIPVFYSLQQLQVDLKYFRTDECVVVQETLLEDVKKLINLIFLHRGLRFRVGELDDQIAENLDDGHAHRV